MPVVLGAALNQNFPRAVTRTAPFAPLVAVIAVVLIVASVMAQNAAAVTLAGPKLIGAIIALHTGMLSCAIRSAKKRSQLKAGSAASPVAMYTLVIASTLAV